MILHLIHEYPSQVAIAFWTAFTVSLFTVAYCASTITDALAAWIRRRS